jgi:molybdate transport system substrate-binding protein
MNACTDQGIRRIRAWPFIQLLVLACTLAAACGAGDPATRTSDRPATALTVAAASDLRRALAALQPELERACAARLTFVFGSSGQLKEQILAGAGYHLFLSADVGYVEALARAGRLAPDDVTPYAVGRLALAWRRGLPPLTGIEDLARGDVTHIAIANPAHAPYGRAAQQAMTAAGLWERLQPRLVLGENIRQATDYVQSGNADAGLVALALVVDTDTPYVLVPAALHQPILQAGGVLRGSGGETAARCVLQYLRQPSGQELLKRFGFEPVPPR